MKLRMKPGNKPGTKPLRSALAALCAAAAIGGAHAGEVKVAVAANFIGPAQRLAEGFRATTGHHALLSSGSTGKFYAQIRNGAAFDVLLAADSQTPERLESEAAAVAGSRFTYAVGRLALWSASPDFVDARGEVLRSGRFSHLSICNPQLAPYGAAAVQTLRALGLYERVAPTLVQGEDVAQAYQFVASGNAELGFVALSQIQKDGRIQTGSAWIVSPQLYTPLRQDAVLLNPGRDNPAARDWVEYLRSDAGRAVIGAYGYGLPDRVTPSRR